MKRKLVFSVLMLAVMITACKKDSPDPISGCTDSTAINFNPLATINDSNCIYSVNTNLTINFIHTVDGSDLITNIIRRV